MAGELIRELIRALYHLDLFRRQVRNGASINLNGIKELFSTLSDAMRNPAVQPKTLTNILQSSALLHELGDKSPSDAYNLMASCLLQDFTVFATNFSLTKVCLSCSTCSHEDSVVKYVHHVDSSLLSSADYPSFEFSLKTSLNTNEFCQRINCFGELQIFRVLKQEPSIIALDFESGTLATTLPPVLKPYLVFNSTTSSELYLTSVLLNNPPATVFYHTRLFTWIYTNSESIIPLNTSEWSEVVQEPLLDGTTVVLAFYTFCNPPPVPMPAGPTSSLCVPSVVPNSPVATPMVLPIPIVCQAMVHPEPSPVSIRPHRGLTYSTSRCSSSSVGTTMTSSSLTVPTSPTSTTAMSPTYLHERIYENWPLDNDSGHGSIEPNNSLEDGTSCSSSASSSRSSGSRSSANTAISNKKSGRGFSTINKARFPNMKHPLIPSSCPADSSICREPMLSTVKTTTAITMTSAAPNGIMNYATIKRRRRNKLMQGPTSVSVPDLSLDFKKAVSFNCKVTLVDDCNDEEYIPHPIFEKVLAKLRNQQN